jgi:hypothetical protein
VQQMPGRDVYLDGLLGHRRKLLDAIAALRNDASVAADLQDRKRHFSSACTVSDNKGAVISRVVARTNRR